MKAPEREQQSDELNALRDRSAGGFITLGAEAVRAIVTDSTTALRAVEAKLAELFTETLTLADLLGRETLIQQAAAVAHEHGQDFDSIDDVATKLRVADPKVPVVAVTFEEAVADITSRTPILQKEFKPGVPRYLEVQRLYNEKHSFGLAKSFSDQLTKRVEKLFEAGTISGTSPREAIKAIKETGDFTHSYAETVYMTNLNTAYTAGTFEEMKQPEVALVMGALEFTIVDDDATRDNHRAAEGLIAPTTSKIWDKLTPPLGYNCRCAVFPVDRFTLKDMGLIAADGSIGVRLPGRTDRLKDVTRVPGASADSNNFGGRVSSNVYA